jgi:hypothetical protein
MPMQHHVDAEGRYDGKTLQELWPTVVKEVVQAVDPLEVIPSGRWREARTDLTRTSTSSSFSTTSRRPRSGP